MTPMLKASPLSPERAQAMSIRGTVIIEASAAGASPTTGRTIIPASNATGGGAASTLIVLPPTSIVAGTSPRGSNTENTRATGVMVGAPPNQPVEPTLIDVVGEANSRA